MTSFSQLKLNSWIIRQLDSLGIKEPTPIQRNCIGPILSGSDCIGAAKTGSGKTLAFALPILQKLSEEPYGIFACIITPTRELAVQIKDIFTVIGNSINVKICLVVGGTDMMQTAQELSRQPHIIVCTPGRLADHINACQTFSLKRIQYLVLDEADRLLGGPFDEQIETIMSAVNKNKQVLCFSATITDALITLKNMTKKDVFLWQEESEVATVEQLKQYYLLCPGYVKDGYLVEAIRTFVEEDEHASVIVFTDTCKCCQLLSMTLNKVGYNNVPLHGMISQKQRLESLNNFKSSKVKILIATDVASRGLDIPQVELVINHNVPTAPKNYIHRVGRTARAGKGGIAITIITPSEVKLLHAIESEINTKLKEFTVDPKEVAKIFTQVSVTKRESEIRLDQEDFYERKAIHKRVKAIAEGADPDDENIKHNFTTPVILKRKKSNKFKNKKIKKTKS